MNKPLKHSSKIIYAGLLMLALGVATPSWADTIVFNDGRRVEGRIVSETGRTVTIAVRAGTSLASTTFNKDDIAKIEREQSNDPDHFKKLKAEYKQLLERARKKASSSAWEDLAIWCKENKFNRERKAAMIKIFEIREQKALTKRSTGALLSLADWCRSQGLKAQQALVYRHVLGIDPQNSVARMELGYKELDGKWYEPKAYKVAYAQRMREKGFIEYKDRWYSPQALEALAKVKKAEALEEIKKLRKENAVLSQQVRASLKAVNQLVGRVQTLETRIVELKTLQERYVYLNQCLQTYGTRIDELQRWQTTLRARLRGSGSKRP